MATPLSTEDVAALIGEIYNAATDHSRWQSLMQRVADALSGTSAVMVSFGDPKADGAVHASHNLDPHYIALYEQHYHQYNIGIPRSQEKGLSRAGAVAASYEYLDPGELKQSPWYNELLIPSGAGSYLQLILLDDVTLRGAPPT